MQRFAVPAPPEQAGSKWWIVMARAALIVLKVLSLSAWKPARNIFSAIPGHATSPFEQGCDAILFVGAHAMAGTPDGVLCHTVSSEAWYNAWINETLVGESGILAAIAGCWDVPAVFVSGDEATCREVTALLGDEVTTAPVKTGLGRFSSRNMAPKDACSLIEMRVAQSLSLRNWPKPYKTTAPVTFKVDLATPDHASDFMGRTGVRFEGPRTVVSTADTFWQAWDQFWYRN